MPSALHQTVVDLLRHAPQLVPHLLAVTGAANLEGATVRVLDTTLDQLERRIDLAFEVSCPGLGTVAVGFEVQLRINPDKRRTWPVYLTTMRTQERSLACLVVLTPDPRVAAWAAEPIDLGPGNESFRVHVLGPDQIPRILDPQVAQAHPEMGFLSALAHADRDDDPQLVRAALAGLSTLDSERGRSYGCVLLDSIDKALRAALESSMMEENEPYQSSVTPEFVERALAWGRRALLEGERQMALREQIRREGLAEGREEGSLLARREVLLRLLTRAGLQPSAAEAQRVAACAELATLDRWIDQVIGATSVAAALT